MNLPAGSETESFDEHELEDLDAEQEEGDRSQSVGTQSVRSRGRPRIPEKWSRIISINRDSLDSLRTFPLSTDLLLASGTRASLRKSKEKWAPVFLPIHFVKTY